MNNFQHKQLSNWSCGGWNQQEIFLFINIHFSLLIIKWISSQSRLICTQSVHILISGLVHLCRLSIRIEREVHGIQLECFFKHLPLTNSLKTQTVCSALQQMTRFISITLPCLLWLSFVLSRLISGWIPEWNRQTEILPEAAISLIMLMRFYIESEETRGNLASHKLKHSPRFDGNLSHFPLVFTTFKT